jgi:hypothetical protein
MVNGLAVVPTPQRRRALVTRARLVREIRLAIRVHDLWVRTNGPEPTAFGRLMSGRIDGLRVLMDRGEVRE